MDVAIFAAHVQWTLHHFLLIVASQVMIIGKGHQSDQSNFPVSNDQLRLIAHAARGESNGEIGKNLPRPMNRAAVKQQMYRIGNVAGFHGRTQRYVLGAMITGQLTLDTIWPDEAPVDTQEGPTD